MAGHSPSNGAGEVRDPAVGADNENCSVHMPQCRAGWADERALLAGQPRGKLICHKTNTFRETFAPFIFRMRHVIHTYVSFLLSILRLCVLSLIKNKKTPLRKGMGEYNPADGRGRNSSGMTVSAPRRLTLSLQQQWVLQPNPSCPHCTTSTYISEHYRFCCEFTHLEFSV